MKKKVLVLGSLMLLFTISFSQESLAYEKIHEIEYSTDEKSGLININEPIVPQTQRTSRQTFSVLPTKFDYTTGNVETKMRNQGEVGICWAYSAADVITTSNKKEFGLEYTLSPNYYNYYSATDAFSDTRNPYGIRPLNGGGDTGIALIQSTLGNNGVLEEDFITPRDISQNQPIAIQAFQEKQSKKSPVYIEEMTKIHGISYEDATEEVQLRKVDAIKRKVYEHGAVSFSYNPDSSHNEKYYNDAKKSSFVPISDVGTPLVPTANVNWVKTGHAIVIVGWDDQFSRSNFKIAPKNDGAFLVKNSVGLGNGIGIGYFYISYEDLYILNSKNHSVDTKMTSYDHLKSYVNNLTTHYVNISSTSRNVYLGSAFSTGEKKECLEAISFYSEQAGINYEVYYVDSAIKNGQVPNNKESMKKIASGSLKDSGMKEIKTDPVEIDENKDYSIVIQIIYPSDLDSFHLVIQEVRDAREGKYPDLPAGKTFLSTESNPDRIYWRSSSDGTLFGPNFKGNLYVSAYTNTLENQTVPVTGVTVNPTNQKLEVGAKQQLEATISPTNATNKKIIWSSSNTEIASVSTTGEITAKAAGTATITVTTEDGGKKASSIVNVKQPTVDAQGEFGTVPWVWDDSTQTVIFGKGDFPKTGYGNNIQTVIECSPELAGKRIKKVKFTKPVKADEDSSYLFGQLKELEVIEQIELLDMSEVRSMGQMFNFAESLLELDLSSWDTSKVEWTNGMFQGASSLKCLDLNEWDVSNISSMQGMFSCTKNLEQLSINEWDVSNVMYMQNMFSETGLVSLDINNWNIANLWDTTNMFLRADKLENINISNWDTSNVRIMVNMFHSAKSLTNLDLNRWDTSNVTNMSGMFFCTASLTTLNLNNWDTSKVNTMNSMFTDAQNLTTLEISNWDTSRVKDMRRMFAGTLELKELDLSRWNTQNVTDMSSMFVATKSLTSIDINDWNIAKVTNMSDMFSSSGLVSLDLSNWDVSHVKDLTRIFIFTNSLERLTLGEKSIFGTSSYLYECKIAPYTGQWVLESSEDKLTFSSSWTFMAEYDGSKPGTYVREKI